MTLSSRHRIQNLSPGGLRPSTLPLGHGGSPQYWLSHVDGEETFLVSSKPPRPGTEPRTLAWKAAVLTTTLGPPRATEQSEQSLLLSFVRHGYPLTFNISLVTWLLNQGRWHSSGDIGRDAHHRHQMPKTQTTRSEISTQGPCYRTSYDNMTQ